MANLLDLAKRLEKRAASISTDANEVKKATALKMVDYLIDETPVDTSNALSNWQVGLGRPVGYEPRGPFVRGDAGSSAAASRAAAKEAARGLIAAAKPGQPIYLSNVTAYIRRLNDGWSKQHPGGFIEAAILLGRKFVNSVKLVRLRK